MVILIADVCEKLGYLTARGSTSRGGSSALRNMIAQSRKYSLAFTPDGPKGPACKIKEGMVYLAKIDRFAYCLDFCESRT